MLDQVYQNEPYATVTLILDQRGLRLEPNWTTEETTASESQNPPTGSLPTETLDQQQDRCVNSGHVVEVVPVELLKHDNADSLSVVDVFGGYTCVVRTEDWAGITKAAYIPPDSLVDTSRPEFAWLLKDARFDGYARIRAKKIRGIVSLGMLVPISGFEIGDDVTGYLGVMHYQPPVSFGGSGGCRKDGTERFMPSGQVESPKGIVDHKYDLENWRKYHKLFVEGEEVIIEEKLDGTNSRYSFANGSMHCGSRQQWKCEYPTSGIKSLEDLLSKGCPAEKAEQVWSKISGQVKQRSSWWAMLDQCPEIERWCRDHENDVLYGEIAGTTNMIKYGANRFAGFNILRNGHWVDKLEQRTELASYGVPLVPLLYRGPYSTDVVKRLAEGKTTWDGASPVIREGCVVVPVQERRHPHIGRVALKCVGGGFLSEYKGDDSKLDSEDS